MKTDATFDGDTCNVKKLYVYQHSGTHGPDVAPELELECEFVEECRRSGISLIVIENVTIVNGQLMIPVDLYWCDEFEGWMRKRCDHSKCSKKNQKDDLDLNNWLNEASQ